MATVDDVAALALSLPEVTEGTTYGNRAWFVDGTFFTWVRPFSKADIRRFGHDPVPDGEIVAVKVDDLAEKEAALQAHGPAVFTISHFDGFPAVLVQLDEITDEVLAELVEEAWLSVAPAGLVRAFMGDGAAD